MGASDFSKLPHIGESLKRKEDYRFLTGAGQYTDDVVLAAQSHAVFVRSPHAHAKINSINVEAAKAAPGVLGVFTGADVAADNINGLPCGWLITSTDGQPMKEPPHPILAQGKVRYVGDHVAMVVADTLENAKNAAELVEVDYEPLPAVVDVPLSSSGLTFGLISYSNAEALMVTRRPLTRFRTGVLERELEVHRDQRFVFKYQIALLHRELSAGDRHCERRMETFRPPFGGEFAAIVTE